MLWASKQIREGKIVMDAFHKIMGPAPTKFDKSHTILKAAWLDTPLGPMIAMSDENAFYLLEFVDRRGLEREVERLRIKTKAAIIPGMTCPIRSIESGLQLYFEGTLIEFKTPLHLLGSPFQKQVWEALSRIPYGQTRSYAQQAKVIGKQMAY